MNTSSNWLVHDHRRYDSMLDDCENAADCGEWNSAKRLFSEFVDALKLHMQMEDEVLYPLFIEEHGDPDGVIGHLGDEHDELVRLVNDLGYIIRNNDFDHFLDSLEPLHHAMNIHNKHEERVFLNMASPGILMKRDEVMQRLATMENNGRHRDWEF